MKLKYKEILFGAIFTKNFFAGTIYLFEVMGLVVLLQIMSGQRKRMLEDNLSMTQIGSNKPKRPKLVVCKAQVPMIEEERKNHNVQLNIMMIAQAGQAASSSSPGRPGGD